MKRKESALVAERNAPVVERIKELKAEHPFWGYRRLWAHLKYIDNLEIDKRRVFRLLKKHDLLVKPDTRLKAIRTPAKSKPRPERPNQWWGIDMTKVMVQGFGWMYNRGCPGLVYQEDSWILRRHAMSEQTLARSARYRS